MSRRLDVINLADPEQRRPAPAMPSACETGGCGEPEAIAREIQHHPAPDAESAWVEAARALAVRELLLQEARRIGLEPDPEEDEAGRVEAEDDALVRMLLEEEVRPARAGEEECRR